MTGTRADDADEMRRQILAEREKRRAVLLKEKAAQEAAMSQEDADPAMAPVNDAVRRIAVHPLKEPAAGLLLRALSNVVNDPSNAKYRKMRLANKKVAAAVLDTDGGLQLLEAVGFRVVFEEETTEGAPGAAEEAGDPRVLVLDDSVTDMAPLNAALRRLTPLAPRVAAQLTAPKPPPPVDPRKPPPGGRAPQAFLPAAVCSAAVTELSDDYFQRDVAELQAEMKRKQAKREQEAVLTTRAYKERMAREAAGEEDEEEGAQEKEKKPVRIRVRMPDETQLEGQFGAREKVGAVREFVAGCLREPFREFTLSFLNAPLVEGDGTAATTVTGARGSMAIGVSGGSGGSSGAGYKGRGYDLVGTIEGAGLAPSALIHFKWTDAPPGQSTNTNANTDGGGGGGGVAQVLTDALMSSAVPLE